MAGRYYSSLKGHQLSFAPEPAWCPLSCNSISGWVSLPRRRTSSISTGRNIHGNQLQLRTVRCFTLIPHRTFWRSVYFWFRLRSRTFPPTELWENRYRWQSFWFLLGTGWQTNSGKPASCPSLLSFVGHSFAPVCLAWYSLFTWWHKWDVVGSIFELWRLFRLSKSVCEYP